MPDTACLTLGHAERREVDRFVEAVPAEHAGPRQPIEVAQDVDRHDRRRQDAGIRCDDEIVGEAALQAEARDAEGPVLVIAIEVLRVVGRLRDAPGHATARGVVHLPRDDRAVGLVEQRARVGAHDE
jgi:hypothetical protein